MLDTTAVKYHGGIPYGMPVYTGDTIGMTIDLDDAGGKVELFKNNVSMGVLAIDVKSIGKVYAAFGLARGGTDKITVNFGATPFKYPVPNGFTPYGNSSISSPTTLTATAGNAKVDLSWTAVDGAASYNVKRSTTAGGPYETIVSNMTTTTYTDTAVTNGTIYYYVVTAVSTAGESANSNEASATLTAPSQPSGGPALLVITMTNGMEKEYEMTGSEITAFIDWYNGRAGGYGTPYYIIDKKYNKGPFTSRKDYIVFDKIQNFEVMEYSN